VVNLLHEARGLDTYPLSLKKFQGAGDSKSIEILNRNYGEEIFHVATALKWFRYLCQRNDSETGIDRDPSRLPSTFTFLSLSQNGQRSGLFAASKRSFRNISSGR
jgi:hypothetical protein